MKNKWVILLIVIGLLLYFNSLFNGFVWDDEEQVLNNLPVHSIGNIFQFFSESTFNSGGSGTLGGLYYKPLMTVFFSLIYTVFGPNAFFFHLLQVSIHLASSVIVFLILKRILKKETLSFFLALIFLVHPLNTETVVYISDLQDILFFFFGVLGLNYATKGIISLKRWLILTGLLLASLLSKETGVGFIIIIGAYFLFFKRHELLRYIGAICTVAGVYSFLRFVVAGIFFNKHGLSPITVMPLSERILSIPKIIFSYLKTFVFPKNLAINQHWAVKSLTWNNFTMPLMVDLTLFVILVSIAAILWKKKSEDLKAYLFFFVWFTTGLGMHLQIFPLDLTYSDRWFYLPMVGLLGMAGTIFANSKIENSLKIGTWKLKIFTACLLVIILALSARTFIRNFDWKDGLTLYGHDIKVSQNSFDLENNYGVELFRHGQMDEAAIHFEKSAQLAPKWWTNWNNLGVVAERRGDYQKAKEYYKKAIDNGQYYLAYENYANILLFQDKDNQKARDFTTESLKLLPYNAKLWLILTIADYNLKKTDEALMAARQAYLLSPSDQTAYVYSRLSQNQPLEIK